MKKMNVKKSLVIIVILIIILFLVNIIRNYTIITKIENMQNILRECTNYSYTTKEYDMGSLSDFYMTEHYYKDGINMLKIQTETENIIWNDEENLETVFINTDELTASIMEGTNTPLMNNLIEDEGMTVFEKLFISSTSFILSEAIDNINCYTIHTINATSYIDKEYGYILKQITNNTITEYSDYRINELTDNEMSKPELDNYTIK